MPPRIEEEDLELREWQRREGRARTLWIGAVGLGAAALSLAAWFAVDQRGMSVRGIGHVLRLDAEGAGWVLLQNGSLFATTEESARRFGLRTGPCRRLTGSMRGFLLDLEEADCEPGPLARPVGERLRAMRLRVAYWPEELVPSGDELEPHLGTFEVYASMVDRHAPAPQLVALYTEPYPGAVARARAAGALPPPVILHAQANAFAGRRAGAPEVAEILSRERFILAGAAVRGGWLVRTVLLGDDGPAPVERLLSWPDSEPWPELLRSPTLQLRRPGAAPPRGEAPSAPQ